MTHETLLTKNNLARLRDAITIRIASLMETGFFNSTTSILKKRFVSFSQCHSVRHVVNNTDAMLRNLSRKTLESVDER